MATEELAPGAIALPQDDERMPIHGIDHVELYVGNAAQAAFYFAHAFGFVETAYADAVGHGARGLMTPHWVEDEHGRVQLSSIATYGDTQHLFVQREGYQGAFLPGYDRRAEAPRDPGDMRLMAIDHIVGNVELGHMEEWVRYYERVFGMTEMIHFSDEAISTEYSALMSKVVTDGSGRIKFPINE